MTRNLIRTSTFAALALLAALTLTSTATARAWDNDDRRGDVARHGYDNGYRDGLEHGRYDRSSGFRYNTHSQQYDDARDGYQSWMGSYSQFKSAFRNGYNEGYRAGYSGNAYYRRDGDRDDFRSFHHDNWRGNSGRSNNIAFENGRIDGSTQARSDLDHRKSFNPNPRGRYDDEDHGYRRELGDKNAYKADYTAGYRAGYQSVFRY